MRWALTLLAAALGVSAAQAEGPGPMVAHVQILAESKGGSRAPASEARICAHRLHAYGTRLSLWTSTNRRAACVVRARGPYVQGKDRDLDVSPAVATELGLQGVGPFEVRYTVVGRETH